MVTCKEIHVVIIALHQRGFTGNDIAIIAPKLTIYQIIKNFEEKGSFVMKKASGFRRKSCKFLNLLLKFNQLHDQRTTSVEFALEWQQPGVSASGCTISCRLLEDGLVSRLAAKKQILSRKTSGTY